MSIAADSAADSADSAIDSANSGTDSMAASAQSSVVAQVVADIQDDRLELPGFPEAVLRIQRTLEFPDATVDDVVKILSSEHALAAEALRIANSVMFRRRDREITDLRTAVNRMGFSLMRSIAVAFAIRQLRQRETYTAAARAEIETIWRDSLNAASICFVIARHYTQVNADQALLTGLLHVLGRLYLVTRAESDLDAGGTNTPGPARAGHATIAAAILKGWGLSKNLQRAVEHQDDLDFEAEDVSVTDVLIAAKLLGAGTPPDPAGCPVLRRIAAVRNKSPIDALTEHADELRALRASLGA
jgi:HD-like signal output (HDOD) protein